MPSLSFLRISSCLASFSWSIWPEPSSSMKWDVEGALSSYLERMPPWADSSYLFFALDLRTASSCFSCWARPVSSRTSSFSFSSPPSSSTSWSLSVRMVWWPSWIMSVPWPIFKPRRSFSVYFLGVLLPSPSSSNSSCSRRAFCTLRNSSFSLSLFVFSSFLLLRIQARASSSSSDRFSPSAATASSFFCSLSLSSLIPFSLFFKSSGPGLGAPLPWLPLSSGCPPPVGAPPLGFRPPPEVTFRGFRPSFSLSLFVSSIEMTTSSAIMVRARVAINGCCDAPLFYRAPPSSRNQHECLRCAREDR
mmetsp:Transcript_2661/g.6349  ORF Transcript_2661/g.6349 Transcript_2661/m.6349 type:complete len:305 (+) Transcript_2661:2356-3270(+)